MATRSQSFTVAEAREKFIAKLRMTGAKGALGPVTGRATAATRQIYEEALAQMIREGEIVGISRAAKTRYFLAEAAPGAASTGRKIEQLAEAKHPALLAITEFKIVLSVLEKPFLVAAVQQLESAGSLIRLVRGKTFVFAHAASLRAMLEEPVRRANGLEGERVRESYRKIAARTGFPAVEIAALQRESGAEMENLKRWLLTEREAGRAQFGLGDWSLADETTRAGAVEVRGERHLLVRLEE